MAGRLVAFSPLYQDNLGRFDQGGETNARCAVKDRSNLVCCSEQSHRQETPFGDPTRMGDRFLHPACLSQSTRTSPDRKKYQRMGGKSRGKHSFRSDKGRILIHNRNPNTNSLFLQNPCGLFGSTHPRRSSQASRDPRPSYH